MPVKYPTITDPKLQEHLSAITQIHEAFTNAVLFDRPIEALEDMQELAHLRELYPEAWAMVKRVHSSTVEGAPFVPPPPLA